MSLLQLLTTGKALEGLHDSSNRYQMTNKRLLPKFGSKRNPFAAIEAAASGELPGEPVPDRAPAVPAVVKSPPPSIFSAGTVRQSGDGRFAKWLGGVKTRVLGWFGKPGKVSPRPAAAVTQPVPSQGELLLEGIKVVRNDLSESDLEVVKTKPVDDSGSAAEMSPARKPAEPRRAWDRMRARLVGAGKN